MNSLLTGLNKEQQQAVQHTEGPLLILAGAGSGKTKVLTVRIAHLLAQGVNPYEILAITFTNKAAKEMKSRVEGLVGDVANRIWLSTFHSFCAKFLRFEIDSFLGYNSNFTIYDTSDSQAVIKAALKALNLDDKYYPVGAMIAAISDAKNKLLFASDFRKQARDFYQQKVADVYEYYERELRKNNALDFDDLLLVAVKLLQSNATVLDIYSHRFRYVMIDEYQDTNNIQYEIINLIAAKYRNICVVGDEDQSIYAFRGANIENILNFEKDYPDAYTIKLERNYRSTKRILDTANELIRNNKSSKGKKLWTNGEKGEKIKVFNAPTVYDEAEFIVKEIKSKSKSGVDYKDMTILYRTNAQSRVLEEKLLEGNVPYKIYGGMQFFQRKEIKDILAYMNLLNNPNDNHNFYRIINVPKRAIGDKTLEKIAQLANEKGISMLESTKYIDEIPGLRTAVKEAIKSFYKMMNGIYERLDELSVKEVFDEVLIQTKYIDSIEDNKEDRVKNIEELLNSITESERQNPGMSLSEYLDMVSLTSSTDDIEDEENFIKLMTIHSSKGLEFDYVFIAGMEDGLFPSCNFDTSEDEIEEERRLCYVAVTRAKKELYLSHVSERMVWGQMNYMIRPSRFISEMKQGNLDYLSEKNDKLSKKTGTTILFNQEPKRKIENFNPFSLKSVRTSELRNKEKSKYKVGDVVNHIKFGKGKIKKVDEKSLLIDFMTGEKKIALILAEKLLKG